MTSVTLDARRSSCDIDSSVERKCEPGDRRPPVRFSRNHPQKIISLRSLMTYSRCLCCIITNKLLRLCATDLYSVPTMCVRVPCTPLCEGAPSAFGSTLLTSRPRIITASRSGNCPAITLFLCQLHILRLRKQNKVSEWLRRLCDFL